MGCKLITRNNTTYTKLNAQEYIVDTDADIESLPQDCAVGSTAIVIESGRIFMVNSCGEWKPFGEA